MLYFTCSAHYSLKSDGNAKRFSLVKHGYTGSCLSKSQAWRSGLCWPLKENSHPVVSTFIIHYISIIIEDWWNEFWRPRSFTDKLKIFIQIDDASWTYNHYIKFNTDMTQKSIHNRRTALLFIALKTWLILLPVFKEKWP